MGYSGCFVTLTKPKPKGKWNALFTIQEQFLRGLKVSDLQEFQARLFAFTFVRDCQEGSGSFVKYFFSQFNHRWSIFSTHPRADIALC
jgi:hypothetical protein